MSGSVSYKSIAKAVNHLKQTIEVWENLPLDQCPVVQRGNLKYKAVSEEIQHAAVELFELVDTDEVEKIAKPLVLAIDGFDEAFTGWAEEYQRSPDNTAPSGSAKVWEAWQVVLQELKLRTWRLPESVGSLLAMKPAPTDEKIAKMYGWVDENGTAQPEKVREELMTPGTHFDPATWEHPSAKKFWRGIDAEWSKRAESASKRQSEPSKERPATKAKREAPESIDELIRSGTNSAQIVKMKHVSLEQVRQRAEDLGLPLDGVMVSKAILSGKATTDDEIEIAQQAEAMRIAGINSHPELGDDSQARIMAMAADGQKPGDIASALQGPFPGLTMQKVGRVIKSQQVATTK